MASAAGASSRSLGPMAMPCCAATADADDALLVTDDTALLSPGSAPGRTRAEMTRPVSTAATCW